MALRDLTFIRPFRIAVIHQEDVQDAVVVYSPSILAGIRGGKQRFLELLMSESEPNKHEMAFLFTNRHRLATGMTIAALEEKLLERKIRVLTEYLDAAAPGANVIKRCFRSTYGRFKPATGGAC